MQSVDIKGLEELTENLNALLAKAPEARRKLHEELADMAKKEVDAQIVASGIQDDQGKIREWQEEHVGSGGGYAAVRAAKGSTGDNSPGAITNYIESGHKIRQPSSNAKHYKPRINMPYVEGRHFYQNAQRNVDAKAVQIAEQFAEKLADRIEGGGSK